MIPYTLQNTDLKNRMPTTKHIIQTMDYIECFSPKYNYFLFNRDFYENPKKDTEI